RACAGGARPSRRRAVPLPAPPPGWSPDHSRKSRQPGAHGRRSDAWSARVRPRPSRRRMGRPRARVHRPARDARARRPPTQEPLHPQWRGPALAVRHRLGDGRVGRPRSRPRPHRPANLLVGRAVRLARRAARGRAAARRRGAHLPGADRDSLGEPAARLRVAPLSEPPDVVAAGHARSPERRRPRAGSGGMTDLRAALQRAVSDTAEPGAAELYHALAEALLDSAVHPDPGRVRAVVDLIAELHTRAAGHALLPECRHFCGDLGAPFFAANVRDAIAVLEGLVPSRVKPTPEQRALRSRLLVRLYRLRDELPGRVQMLETLGGPETLLPG